MEQGDDPSGEGEASSFSHKDGGGMIDLSFDIEFELMTWI
jgi:hypothetical protein